MNLKLRNRGDAGPAYSTLSLEGYPGDQITKEARILTLRVPAESKGGDCVLDVEQTVMLVKFLMTLLPPKYKQGLIEDEQIRMDKYFSETDIEAIESCNVNPPSLLLPPYRGAPLDENKRMAPLPYVWG